MSQARLERALQQLDARTIRQASHDRVFRDRILLAFENLGTTLDAYVHHYITLNDWIDDDSFLDRLSLAEYKQRLSDRIQILWYLLQIFPTDERVKQLLNKGARFLKNLNVHRIIDRRFQRLLQHRNKLDTFTKLTKLIEQDIMLLPSAQKKQVQQRLSRYKSLFIQPTTVAQARNMATTFLNILRHDLDRSYHREQMIRQFERQGIFAHLSHIGHQFNLPFISEEITRLKDMAMIFVE